MKMKMVRTTYGSWNHWWLKELRFWGSNAGKELELCLVAQGYDYIVFNKWMTLTGSGFAALEILEGVRRMIENG